MKKEEILAKIDIAILREEDAVPIYAKHLSSAIHWAGLDDDSVTRIKDYLKILRDESMGHAKALRKVKEMINESV